MEVRATAANGALFAGDLTLETVECTCGIVFAIPQRLLKKRRNDGECFYCPLGHSLVFNAGKSSAEVLRERLRLERDWHAGTQARLDQERAHSRAVRGVATRRKNELARVKKRVVNGVCPCCGRTFKQLARHMSAKHPDFDESSS